MNSRDHYIIEFLVSNPPKLGKLASHGHEKPKTRRGNKENGEHGRRRASKVALVSKKMP